MLDLNKVMLIGNLTFDPDFRQTNSGSSVCKLRLAVNLRWKSSSGKSKEDTLFVDVEAWGRTAEFCKDYLSKGRRVFVEGRLTEDRWEDRETGQKRSKVKIVADRVQFADSKPQGESEQGPVSNNQGGYASKTGEDLPF